MISAEIIADSLHPNKIDRITTMKVTFPRFILAELNTHRMFSRNSASSRAIPFKKMIESVKENPFIPIAWQKDHSGMQGTEYFTEETEINVNNYMWMEALWNSTRKAKHLHESGVTKQLCNRLLEPFMWHTVLITTTEFSNFFELRCPRYTFEGNEFSGVYWSKKDVLKAVEFDKEALEYFQSKNDLFWLKCNKGQSEIHMMALAEAMWDAINESIPKQLKGGEWHIPFRDNIDGDATKWADSVYGQAKLLGKDLIMKFIKVATARCARISYTIVGEENKIPNYENDIKLHDKLLESGHFSPFEHCAKVMTEKEYFSYIKTNKSFSRNGNTIIGLSEEDYGWCRNYKGFIQYRELID